MPQPPVTITVHHADRNIDFTLSVEPYCDDSGRYVEPNLVMLLDGVVWVGKRGFDFEPATNIEAKAAGFELMTTMRSEIDAAMNERFAKSLEHAD